jgi:bifunctional UDP-N-acetylglucosamine pyrophosphorylase / glucosamine-1-phosphate N-acetyltransferase
VERVVVIPAAGTGSRLGSNVPKLLVPVNGRPMIQHLLALYRTIADRAVVVVAPSAQADVLKSLANAVPPVALVTQSAPTGMLDAVLLARHEVQRVRPRRVLITWCDQIAVRPETVTAVVAASRVNPEPAVAMPTWRGEHPYVHLVRDASGRIVRVLHRREGDEMPASGESDAGVFDLSAEAFLDWLPQYAAAPEIGPRTGERNFVPFVGWVSARGPVVTIPCTEPEEAIGINTPDELAHVEAHLRRRETR